ncbi:MAG: c-type cytochrome [Acidimicrobiia bacterium]
MRPLFIVVLLLAAVSAACSSGPVELTPLSLGKNVYADTCSVCHGALGEGGTGPALTDVAGTWPSCGDHIRWITLGSDRWKTEVGNTYGATPKPLKGGMPSQDGVLEAEEIAAVAAFERVEYGGVAEEHALVECGFEAPADS